MKNQSFKFGNTFVKICIARFSFFSFTLGCFVFVYIHLKPVYWAMYGRLDVAY